MPERPWKLYQEQAKTMLDSLERYFPSCLSTLRENGELEQLHRIIAGVSGIPMDDRIAYAKHLETLDTDSRRELAYLGGLLISDLYEGSWQDITAAFCGQMDIGIPSAVTFAGWAGPNRDIGPSYRIRQDCFGQGRRLFYMDSDMARDHVEAMARLRALQKSASGLGDFSLERIEIPMMLTNALLDYQDTWIIAFRLDPAQVRSVIIQGREVCPKNGDGLLIVPKTREYDLFIGEWMPCLLGPGTAPGMVHECRHYCLK